MDSDIKQKKSSKGFDKALEFVLKWEGLFTLDPSDSGNWTGGMKGQGELKGTKYGISAASYPNEDIKNLTKEKAGLLYKKDYWNATKCDTLKWPLSCVIFDMAVNMGVSRAKRYLERFKTAEGILDGREAFYVSLAERKPAYKKFLKGWLNRINSLRDYIKE